MAWADDPFNASASEGTEWRALVATPMVSRPAGFDTDNDGMPDAWETAHGLNPAVADNNGDFDGDGYTNLEEYINEIAAWPATAELMFTGKRSVRYAEIDNWHVRGGPATAIWQPSALRPRRDRGRDGDRRRRRPARGDAAGRRRRRARARDRGAGVSAAAGSRSPGALRHRQRGGGRRGDARVALAGGVLDVARLDKPQASARFDFTGGTLHADAVGFDLVDDGGVIAPGRRGGARAHADRREPGHQPRRARDRDRRARE